MAPMSKTLAPSIVTTRDPKGIKFMSIVEAAYNKAGLFEEDAQRVNEASGLSDLLAKFIAENRCKFRNEEVRSSWTYSKEYKGPKPIGNQIKDLAKIFDLNPAAALEYAKNLPELPEGAEGWFAIPSVDALSRRYFPEVTDPVKKYCRAIQKVAALQLSYYRNEDITPAHLRLSDHTTAALDQLAETQKGDIMIIAAQLGMRHRGRSTRRAREVFVINEFGLGSLIVGSIILTHPERLIHFQQLNIDCPGDEFSPNADGQFNQATYFASLGDWISLSTADSACAYDRFGSASGFLPLPVFFRFRLSSASSLSKVEL